MDRLSNNTPSHGPVITMEKGRKINGEMVQVAPEPEVNHLDISDS